MIVFYLNILLILMICIF